MFDIFFISYQEPNADENWNRLVSRFPLAKRIHGVKGIHAAHIKAAKQCFTKMFWVVDGDAQIVEDFNFSHTPDQWNNKTVHVWCSKNPINDLVYGYGGVKLLPRDLTINMDLSKIDMTTSISENFKVVQQISNVTAFNTDPFSTWRSAFRECAKLASKSIDRQDDYETSQRLRGWTTEGHDKPFGYYSLRGARAGMEFGFYNKSELSLINNYEWLKNRFNETTC